MVWLEALPRPQSPDPYLSRKGILCYATRARLGRPQGGLTILRPCRDCSFGDPAPWRGRGRGRCCYLARGCSSRALLAAGGWVGGHGSHAFAEAEAGKERSGPCFDSWGSRDCDSRGMRDEAAVRGGQGQG